MNNNEISINVGYNYRSLKCGHEEIEYRDVEVQIWSKYACKCSMSV